MDRSSSSLVLCAVFVLLFHFSAAQTVHVVGDGMGWTVPPNLSAYADWASSRTFMVGDILQFNFMTNQHDVLRVPQPSYTACSDDNEIGDIITTGPVNITLDSAGDHYYICTISTHCQMGQRLALSVGSGATNPPMMAPPTTPTTPSPTSTQPKACEPSPSNAGGPEAAMTPRSPRQGSASGSTSLAAGFLLSALSAGMALIF